MSSPVLTLACCLFALCLSSVAPRPLKNLQSLVTQRLMFVGRTDSGKTMALRQLLSGAGGLAADGSSIGGLLPPILVFVATKTRAQVGVLGPGGGANRLPLLTPSSHMACGECGCV